MPTGWGHFCAVNGLSLSQPRHAVPLWTELRWVADALQAMERDAEEPWIVIGQARNKWQTGRIPAATASPA